MNGAMNDKKAGIKASAMTTTTAVVVRLGVGDYVRVCAVGGAWVMWFSCC